MAQTTYAQGEEVKFQVHNTGNNTADLEGCYYVIKHREGTQGEEFFTSRRNPFEVRSLDTDHKQGWTWDQWDNERQHKAPAGQWKLVFFAPKVAFSPVEVEFKIE